MHIALGLQLLQSLLDLEVGLVLEERNRLFDSPAVVRDAHYFQLESGQGDSLESVGPAIVNLRRKGMH